MNPLHLALVALSLAGNVLVGLKHRSGFACWAVTNVGWFAVDAGAGAYERAALFAAYFGMSVWAWRRWGLSEPSQKMKRSRPRRRRRCSRRPSSEVH